MIKYIDIHAIKLRETSQRDSIDGVNVDSLATSIKSLGLLNPITVALTEDGDYQLLAGEHRLLAFRSLSGTELQFNDDTLPLDTIPATIYATPSELKRFSIELEENTVRTQLTWQEQAKAIKLLSEFETLKSGEVPTMTELSELSDRSVSSISDDLFLADFTDDVEVNKAKSKKEAIAVAKRKTERDFLAALTLVPSDAPIHDRPTPHTLLPGSAFDILPTLEGNFSTILTDPPYGVGVDTYGYDDGRAHPYADTEENALRCYTLLAEHGMRLLNNHGHLYAFCASTDFHKWYTLFMSCGWNVWKSPLIWLRGTGRQPTKYGPKKTYDMILYARCGDRPTVTSHSDVLNIPALREMRGAQKPVAAYTNLLQRSSLAGELVLDPFCGSGTIFPAATRLSLHATGIEVDEEAVKFAKSRMYSSEEE